MALLAAPPAEARPVPAAGLRCAICRPPAPASPPPRPAAGTRQPAVARNCAEQTRLYFLEVVKARAVTALCHQGPDRERALGRLDADVSHINERIAVACNCHDPEKREPVFGQDHAHREPRQNLSTALPSSVKEGQARLNDCRRSCGGRTRAGRPTSGESFHNATSRAAKRRVHHVWSLLAGACRAGGGQGRAHRTARRRRRPTPRSPRRKAPRSSAR